MIVLWKTIVVLSKDEERRAMLRAINRYLAGLPPISRPSTASQEPPANSTSNELWQ